MGPGHRRYQHQSQLPGRDAGSKERWAWDAPRSQMSPGLAARPDVSFNSLRFLPGEASRKTSLLISTARGRRAPKLPVGLPPSAACVRGRPAARLPPSPAWVELGRPPGQRAAEWCLQNLGEHLPPPHPRERAQQRSHSSGGQSLYPVPPLRPHPAPGDWHPRCSFALFTDASAWYGTGLRHFPEPPGFQQERPGPGWWQRKDERRVGHRCCP